MLFFVLCTAISIGCSYNQKVGVSLDAGNSKNGADADTDMEGDTDADSDAGGACQLECVFMCEENGGTRVEGTCMGAGYYCCSRGETDGDCDESAFGSAPNTLTVDIDSASQVVHKEIFGLLMEILGNDINNGIVNIVVGFAPLKPAEFVIISIQQIAGDIET